MMKGIIELQRNIFGGVDIMENGRFVSEVNQLSVNVEPKACYFKCIKKLSRYYSTKYKLEERKAYREAVVEMSVYN